MKKNIGNKKDKISTKQWIIIVFTFLLFVHIIFTIPAPYDWLESVWSAGDLITFCGTVTLGYVAFNQSRVANEVSNKLAILEAAEYQPLLIAVSFIGTDIFKASEVNGNGSNSLTIMEAELEDNSIFLGYAIVLKSKDTNLEYCHTYELRLKYKGKNTITSIKIISVTFDNIKTFDVNQEISITLVNEDVLPLFINILSDEEFSKKIVWLMN